MTDDQKRILSLEKELAAANDKVASLYAIYESVGEAVVAHENCIAVTANKALLELFGYRKGEVVGQNIVDLFAPQEYHDEIYKRFRNVNATKPFIFQGLKKDGTLISLEAYDREVTIGERKLFISSFRDVTAWMKKDIEIDRLQGSFSAIFNNEEFPTAIISVKQNRYLDVNNRACEILGYTKDEFLNLCPSEMTAESGFDHNRITERKSARYLRSFKKKTGEEVYANVNMCYFEHDGEELFFSIFSDITTEVKQRAIISEKQIFLDQLLIRSEVASWELNISTGAFKCSDNLFSLLGYSLTDIPQTSSAMAVLFHPDDRAPLNTLAKDFFDEKISSFSMDVRMLNKQGNIHWVRVTSIALVCDDKGRAIKMQGIYIDINSYKEKEEKLRVSEEQFRLLFMHIDAGFSLHHMVRNAEGDIVDSLCVQANDTFDQILEKEKGAFVGQKLSTAFPNFLEEWIAIFKKVLDGGERITFSDHYEDSDKHIELNLYSPQDNQVALLVNDITYRVRQEEELARNQKFLKKQNKELLLKNKELEAISSEMLEGRASINNAITNDEEVTSTVQQKENKIFGRWEYDLVNDVFLGSDAVHHIFGYVRKDEKLTLKGLIEFVDTSQAERVKDEFFGAVKSSTVCKQEYTIHVDGVAKYILSHGMPQLNADGVAYKYIGVIIDITDRKKIEERLRRQNDHYLRLNEELIVSKVKAEESEKLKTAFFANMSHEIRTPMNGILGFSGLLLEPNVDDADRLEYSQIIVDSGKRLLSVVNDILDISKIESDTVKIIKKEVNLNKLLTQLYRLFGQAKKSEGVKLSLVKGLNDEDSHFVTDSNRLSQILSNLLSNALKFTTEGEVSLGYSLENDMVVFYVKDTGVGIPLDMQKKIFEPFRQVDSLLVRQHGGTGLGLSISQKLTSMLGGNMTLYSRVDQGSTFTFTIPYVRAKEAQRVELSNTPINTTVASAKKLVVLIAEDEEINFLFFKSFLGKKVNLLRATNGREAVDMVEKHPEIDLVLMDIKMPIMNGLEATKIIKAKRTNLPVIAQTAYAMSEDKELSKAAGCDNYITKPINRKHLLEMINSYCN